MSTQSFNAKFILLLLLSSLLAGCAGEAQKQQAKSQSPAALRTEWCLNIAALAQLAETPAKMKQLVQMTHETSAILGGTTQAEADPEIHWPTDEEIERLIEPLLRTRGKTLDLEQLDFREGLKRLGEKGTIVWRCGTRLRNRERNWPDGKPREAYGEILLEGLTPGKGQWVRNGLTLLYDRNGRLYKKIYYIEGTFIREAEPDED